MSRDDLKEVKARAANWIGSADTKATALLAIQGVLLAVVLAGEAGDATQMTGECVLFFGFCLLTIVGVFAAAMVLWPRTDRKSYLKKGGCENPSDSSSTFFCDFSAQSYASFEKWANGKAAIGADRADLVEQTYVLGWIASRKMFGMKIAVVFVVLAMVAMATLVGFRAVFVSDIGIGG